VSLLTSDTMLEREFSASGLLLFSRSRGTIFCEICILLTSKQQHSFRQSNRRSYFVATCSNTKNTRVKENTSGIVLFASRRQATHPSLLTYLYYEPRYSPGPVPTSPLVSGVCHGQEVSMSITTYGLPTAVAGLCDIIALGKLGDSPLMRIKSL
jgi:hypothetical protein